MPNLSTIAMWLLAVAVWAGPLAAAGSKEKVTLGEFLQQVPTRVEDKDGTPGDMVNFILVGSRPQVEAAFAAAGWKPVDRTPTEAVLRILISVLQKQVYVELPISELFLFGRPQDYGYARADPLVVVVERHHFRLWESPWQTPDGEDIWLGAGTHDIGLEEDQRSGDITHKIDPEVDKERDFIGLTLHETGRVAGLGYLRPPEPVREATTAHGGPYHSDGRILAIILRQIE
jgi:hypothetical protein